MRFRAIFAVLLCCFFISGCESCSRDKQVPFDLDRPDASEPVDPPEHVANAAEPVAGMSHKPGNKELQVGEETFLPGNGDVRATLPVEFKDGSLGTYFISHQNASVSARLATKQPTGFSDSEIKSVRFNLPCDITSTSLTSLSPDLVHAHIDAKCPEQRHVSDWFISSASHPRTLIALSRHESDTPLVLIPVAVDPDQDGHSDLIVSMSLSELPQPAIQVNWRNLPAGLTQQGTPPIETLIASEGDADAKLSLFFRVCEEGGEGVFDGHQRSRIACGDAALLSPIRASAVSKLIDEKRYAEAQALGAKLDSARVSLAPADKTTVDLAWSNAASSAPVSIKKIAESAARAQLWFADNNTLVIGGPDPRAIDLQTGDSVSIAESPTISDPQQRFDVAGMKRDCRGYFAMLNDANGEQREILVENDSQSAPCIRNASSWEVVGWAPQGLVLYHIDALWVLPLSLQGKAMGAPFAIANDSSPPAPINGPAIASNGQRLLLATPNGILIRSFGPGNAVQWLRPRQWSSFPGPLLTRAWSPDGRKAAIQKGNTIALLQW